MITAIFITLGIIVFGGAAAGIAWLVFLGRRPARAKKTAIDARTDEGPAFRWQYIIAPASILLISLILAACFYPQLPAEVAAHFRLDGTPDGWLSRELTMAWMLAPQLLLALIALAVAWGITKIKVQFGPTANTLVNPEQILLFMGNAIALPQLVLFIAMLDIFSYNAYQKHILPMWLLLLVILGLVTIALGVLLALTISKARQQLSSQSDQKTKE